MDMMSTYIPTYLPTAKVLYTSSTENIHVPAPALPRWPTWTLPGSCTTSEATYVVVCYRLPDCGLPQYPQQWMAWGIHLEPIQSCCSGEKLPLAVFFFRLLSGGVSPRWRISSNTVLPTVPRYISDLGTENTVLSCVTTGPCIPR